MNKLLRSWSKITLIASGFCMATFAVLLLINNEAPVSLGFLLAFVLGLPWFLLIWSSMSILWAKVLELEDKAREQKRE